MPDPLVDLLGMRAHPEGGWYVETWRASSRVNTPHGDRASATGILFLLEAGQRSAWHRVRSEELWLHHGPGRLVLSRGGSARRPAEEPDEVVLGTDLVAGERPQALVPADCWQRARPAGDGVVLVSCVVSPGFDFADFSLLD